MDGKEPAVYDIVGLSLGQFPPRHFAPSSQNISPTLTPNLTLIPTLTLILTLVS